MTLSETIRQEARHLGFQAVGISRVQQSPSLSEQRGRPSPPPPLTTSLQARLLEWLRRGYHGTMTWMQRDPHRRADPEHVLEGCRSVISVGMNHYTEHRPDERPGRGRIARYAWGADYHDVLMDRLKQVEKRIRDMAPGAGTKLYVDTGPVMEKAWAQQGGLGWIGKHTNLVSPQYGSWLLLGEILTTLELDPDEPGTDLCGSCTRCIQSCPTGAIVEPYVLDATKCISYLTIEMRGPHEASLPDTGKIGNRIFGCDDCLDACPYNLYAEPTQEPSFQPSALTLAPELAQLAGMSEGEFQETFRHSPIRRPKHAGFLRNVQTALSNLKGAVPARTPPPADPR